MIRHPPLHCQKRLRRDDFVYQQIRPLRVFHQIVARPRIPRQNHDLARVLHPIPKRRRHRIMINVKRAYRHAALAMREPLRDVLRRHINPCLRQPLIQVTPDVNIRLKRLLQMRHHIAAARRPPHPKRRLAPHNPARQPQIRYPYQMIRVQMRQKQPVQMRIVNPQLKQPLYRAAPAIHQQPRITRLYQRTHPKPLHPRRRRTCSQQRYPEIGAHIGYPP